MKLLLAVACVALARAGKFRKAEPLQPADAKASISDLAAAAPVADPSANKTTSAAATEAASTTTTAAAAPVADPSANKTTSAAATEAASTTTTAAATTTSKASTSPTTSSSTASSTTSSSKSEAASTAKANVTASKTAEAEEGPANAAPSNASEPGVARPADSGSSSSESVTDASTDSSKEAPKFGSSKCPCVGIDGIEGQTIVHVGQNKTAVYPADAFASCEAWDDDRHSLYCKEGQEPGKGNGWCAQKWCYVDPCNCDIDVPPKQVEEGGYFEEGKYQGKTLWYSYATCGSKDFWMDEEKQKEQSAKPKVCEEKHAESKWGDENCRCIGIAGQPGSTNFSIGDGKVLQYPADAGAMCKAWDAESYPDCKGTDAPDWCTKRWCYVDPCSCSIDVAPKPSSYLPDGNFQGRPLYYSYASCGSSDSFTEVGSESCPSQKSKDACSALEKCGWNGDNCVGSDVLKLCGKAKDFPFDSFEAFLPSCRAELKAVVKKVEQAYTHPQIVTALKQECDLDKEFPTVRDPFFERRRDCAKFAEKLGAARKAEMAGDEKAYDDCCQDWWDEKAPGEPRDRSGAGVAKLSAMMAVVTLSLGLQA